MSKPLTVRSPSPLESAAKQVEVVIDSLKTPHRCYLSRDWEVLSSPEKAGDIQDLQRSLQTIFAASQNLDKETIKRKIEQGLEVLFPKDHLEGKKPEKRKSLSDRKSEILAQCKTSVNPKELAKLKQTEISLFLLAYELGYLTHKIIPYWETTFGGLNPLIKHMGKFESKATKAKGGFVCDFTFKLQPKTTEGCAFICQFAKYLDDGGAFFSLEGLAKFSEQDLARLREFGSSSLEEVQTFATLLHDCSYFHRFVKENEQLAGNFVRLIEILKDQVLTESTHLQFLETHISWFKEFYTSLVATYFSSLSVTKGRDHLQVALRLRPQILEFHQKLQRMYSELLNEMQRIQEAHFRLQKMDFFKTYQKLRWATILFASVNSTFPKLEQVLALSFEEKPKTPTPITASDKAKKKKNKKKLAQVKTTFTPPPQSPPLHSKDQGPRSFSATPSSPGSGSSPMALHSPPLLSAKPPSLPPALHLAKPTVKKVEKPPSIFDKKDFPFKEIKHSPRVSSWFTHPEIPLKGETYCKLTVTEKEEATWKHAFSTLVELFIGTKYSIRGTWDNPTTGKKDLLYCIPAEIVTNGETHRGVFQFCFDGQGEMYHRFFGKTSNVEFIDKVIEIVRGKIEFPTILESLRMKEEGTKQTIVVNGAEKGSFQVSPPFDIVTINDDKFVIKLFKILK